MFLKRKSSTTMRSAQVVIAIEVTECRESGRFAAAIARRVNAARSTVPAIYQGSRVVLNVTV